MQKHFVTFLSPGTFVAEDRTKEIHDWDVDVAVSMARDVVERHGAKPYGFYFTTRGRTEIDLDSKVVAKSPTYWLGGKIKTIEEIRAQGESILLSNMECNGWSKVITNTNSYRWTQPFEDGKDILLDVTL